MADREYKHKQIHYPEGVSNINLTRVFKTYTRLRDIYDGNIDYTPDDYYILVITFERLYKGMYIEILKMQDPGLDETQTSQELTGKGHYFSSVVTKLATYIPLSVNKEGEEAIIRNCQEIQKRGNKARFTTEFSFEQFRSDFRRLEISIFRLTQNLEAYIEKNKTADIEEEVDLK